MISSRQTRVNNTSSPTPSTLSHGCGEAAVCMAAVRLASTKKREVGIYRRPWGDGGVSGSTKVANFGAVSRRAVFAVPLWCASDDEWCHAGVMY